MIVKSQLGALFESTDGGELISPKSKRGWQGYDHSIKVTPLPQFDEVLTHADLGDLPGSNASDYTSLPGGSASVFDKPENRGPKPASFFATWWPLFAAAGGLGAVFMLTRKKGRK